MENNPEKNPIDAVPETQEEGSYTPRPVWQVWAARAGLVLFLLLVALQIINIARGGL